VAVVLELDDDAAGRHVQAHVDAARRRTGRMVDEVEDGFFEGHSDLEHRLRGNLTPSQETFHLRCQGDQVAHLFGENLVEGGGHAVRPGSRMRMASSWLWAMGTAWPRPTAFIASSTAGWGLSRTIFAPKRCIERAQEMNRPIPSDVISSTPLRSTRVGL